MITKLTACAAALSCLSTIALAGTYKADINTHPMTGSVHVVDGAKALLVTSEAGIAGSFTTKELTPGNVYTMWVAIMNAPEACAMKDVDHCTSGDVVGRADVVLGDVTIGDGMIVGDDGTATFRTFIPAGEVGRSWIGNGLTNPTGAEIHFALHDHGPAIEGKLSEMMTTAREGCIEESLPKGWPASARAWGETGPNQCSMAQFAILQQK
jgi:hypothetical protein